MAQSHGVRGGGEEHRFANKADMELHLSSATYWLWDLGQVC